MMTKPAIDLEFTEQPEAATRRSDADADAPQYVLNRERVSVYITLAGMLESGIPLDVAVSLMTTESKARRGRKSERVAAFFEHVAAVRRAAKTSVSGEQPVDLGEAATNTFGAQFLIDEETVLLRAMAHTDNLSPLLRASADVVLNSEAKAGAPRANKPQGRFAAA
jgi:hypothetical protein